MYVPLDPGSPVARVEKMIAACDNRWILAGGAVGPTLAGLRASPEFARTHAVGWLDATPPPRGVEPQFSGVDVATYSAEPPACRNSEADGAHILFTSGSTGTPKGVMITHANVRRFIEWAVPYFGTTATDRISAHPPLHFDLSTFDMFGTFAAGAELHLVPPELNLLPHKLAELIRRAQLTQWFSVPSALNYMAKFDVVKQGDFPSLKRVLWCGEVFPTPALIYWMQRVPHASFTNLYGPTEATIASSYYTVPACPANEDETIPIGRACGGEELLVLDEKLRPVPPGEVGEIETALHALGTLRECAVVGVATQDFDGVAICCAYVPLAGTAVKPASLREAVAQTLPSYMLPSRWLAFDELPKTSNGKIDRRR